MTTTMKPRRCNSCNEIKNEEDFYMNKVENRRQSICKKCSNKQRRDNLRKTPKYEKKPKGFNAVQKKIQDFIRYEMYIGRPMTKVIKELPIKYNTFLSWKKKGEVKEWNEEEEVPELSQMFGKTQNKE